MSVNNEKNIGVIGAHLTGTSIAAQFAASGYRVWLYDTSATVLTTAEKIAFRLLEDLSIQTNFVKDSVVTCYTRLNFTNNLAHLAETSLVIDTTDYDSIGQKTKLYETLENCLPAETLIALHTDFTRPSSQCSTLQHPGRFVALQFCTPPHEVPLVEIMPSTRTPTDTLHRIEEKLNHAHLAPVVLKSDNKNNVHLPFHLLQTALQTIPPMETKHSALHTTDFMPPQTLATTEKQRIEQVFNLVSFLVPDWLSNVRSSSTSLRESAYS